ncbi:MAG: class A beta-lactamase-related serine hydrolase [Rhodanobacteraceae bacterium]|nr:MAG: class A beta-lactamase-related serine hydrolase [Rhodanobacteraceae bacterium]
MRLSVFCAGLTCILLAAFAPTAPGAQTHGNPVPPGPPVVHTGVNQAVLPPARVDAALKDYDHWLDQLAAENRTAGLATAVIINDRVRYERTVGYADANTGQEIRPDTVFRLASLSKAFATALTGLLVRQGSLSWDTRLATVLPFFKLRDANASQEATVRDILSQSIGLPHNAYDNLLSDGVPYQELERRLDSVQMTCDPGSCYGYQNIAFSLIGDVVHAETGQFFIQLVDRYLFLPLGMTTASYGRDGLEDSRSWARPHYQRGREWVAYEPNDNFYIPPAAGVNASIRDMEQWLIAQMGGRPMVLSDSLLEVLHSPIIDTPTERLFSNWRRARVKKASYALGWRVYDYAGETLIFHAGAVKGYRSMIGFFPKYHAGVVVLWNCESNTPAGLMPMLFDALLGLSHEDWAQLNRPEPASRRPRHVRHARHKR